MESNYKRLGNYIQQVDVKNTDLAVNLLLGVSIDKKFIESHANTIGTDFSKYKIVKKGQFAYGPVTSRNGDKISIALLKEADSCLVSSSYIPFEITKPEELNAEYLMLLFSKPEFDRYARYNSWGSAREVFSWDDFCGSMLYIPDITEQEKIVRQYKTITDRISVLEKINEELYRQADCLIKHYIFDEIGLEDLTKIDSIELPEAWEIKTLSEVSDCQSGYAFYKDGYTDSGSRIVDLGNITIRSEFMKQDKDKRVASSKYKASKYDKYRLQKNDLVMVMTDRKSTMELLGKAGIIDDDEEMLLNQRVYRIRSNINVAFLYVYLNSEMVHFYHKAHALGTAQKYVNNGDIDSIPIIIPNIEIFDLICKTCSPIMDMMTKNKREIETLNTFLNFTKKSIK